jgi:hypothetical protein
LRLFTGFCGEIATRLAPAARIAGRAACLQFEIAVRTPHAPVKADHERSLLEQARRGYRPAVGAIQRECGCTVAGLQRAFGLAGRDQFGSCTFHDRMNLCRCEVGCFAGAEVGLEGIESGL